MWISILSANGQPPTNHKDKAALAPPAKTAALTLAPSVAEAGEETSVKDEGRKQLNLLEGCEFAVPRLRLNETIPKHHPLLKRAASNTQTPQLLHDVYGTAGTIVARPLSSTNNMHCSDHTPPSGNPFSVPIPIPHNVISNRPAIPLSDNNSYPVTRIGGLETTVTATWTRNAPKNTKYRHITGPRPRRQPLPHIRKDPSNSKNVHTRGTHKTCGWPIRRQPDSKNEIVWKCHPDTEAPRKRQNHSLNQRCIVHDIPRKCRSSHTQRHTHTSTCSSPLCMRNDHDPPVPVQMGNLRCDRKGSVNPGPPAFDAEEEDILDRQNEVEKQHEDAINLDPAHDGSSYRSFNGTEASLCTSAELHHHFPLRPLTGIVHVRPQSDSADPLMRGEPSTAWSLQSSDLLLKKAPANHPAATRSLLNASPNRRPLKAEPSYVTATRNILHNPLTILAAPHRGVNIAQFNTITAKTSAVSHEYIVQQDVKAPRRTPSTRVGDFGTPCIGRCLGSDPSHTALIYLPAPLSVGHNICITATSPASLYTHPAPLNGVSGPLGTRYRGASGAVMPTWHKARQVKETNRPRREPQLAIQSVDTTRKQLVRDPSPSDYLPTRHPVYPRHTKGPSDAPPPMCNEPTLLTEDGYTTGNIKLATTRHTQAMAEYPERSHAPKTHMSQKNRQSLQNRSTQLTHAARNTEVLGSDQF